MYRNLSPISLGITCNQSQLIELTLSHRLGGFDFDLEAFQEQVNTKGIEAASRFLKSAKVKLNAGPLPIEVSSVDGRFESELELSKPLLESIQALGVQRVAVPLEASNASRPYHENFEFHRQRLQRYAEALQEFEMGLALSFQAPEYHRRALPQPFISKAEEMLMLLQLVGQPSVQIVVDVWQWAVAGSSLDLLSGITGDQVCELRLADFPENVCPSEAADEQRAMPGTSNQAPCIEALRQLATMEFQGAVTIAPHLSQLPNQRQEDAVTSLVERFDSLMTAAGLDNKGRIVADAEQTVPLEESATSGVSS